MARPYASEMAKLSETFDWAASTDIGTLRQAVRSAKFLPLRAIGSGGSLTAAHALAVFHQRYTSRIAAVATPLEAVGEPLDSAVSHWLLSASGSNVDILAAAKTLIWREPRQLAVLCGRTDSPLADLCRTYPFTDLLVFPPPAGKDGFLATSSLPGFTLLIARAYEAEFGAGDRWIITNLVRESVNATSSLSAGWEAETTRVVGPTDDPRLAWPVNARRRYRS